ncbi:MAG: iron ABC transporter permease [Saccharofermentans sp.]|nr:iron ABC transporter permease [Saccharofermentans sp.]
MDQQTDKTVKYISRRAGIIISVLACFVVLLICMRCGSVHIALRDIARITWAHITGSPMPSDIKANVVSIFWSIRLPRALMAFFVGGALSVSGLAMQALLQNPLASSYTMGVSSGAGLGAALILVTGISLPVLKALSLPLAGFIFGSLTVIFVLILSKAIDGVLSNTTVILIGMIISLFVTGILNLLSTLCPDHAKQIWMWMTGSLSSVTWLQAKILMPVSVIGTIVIFCLAKHLDIMTFGDEQAKAMGIDVARYKILIILICSLLTGASVAFAGVIGFVDLAAPHIVRKIFGPSHKAATVMSFLYGGAFMALADLISRTILSPREIPVGAVTALIGAPFFAYVFFASRRRKC